MSLIQSRMLTMGLLMLAAAGLAIVMAPSEHIAELKEPIGLERMLPTQFGNWSVDPSVAPIEPSPEVRAQLAKIYNETLSRTYVDSDGRRVMLSIAYGGDQSDSMQVHRPEVCYAAQGFEVSRGAKGTVVVGGRTLPVVRLVATQGRRVEPISYWLVVGDVVSSPGFRQKLAQLKYGLVGRIPDGVLVRVSTIDTNTQNAYENHDRFINAMLGNMKVQDRERIAGRPEPAI